MSRKLDKEVIVHSPIVVTFFNVIIYLILNRLKQKLTGDKVTQWYVVPGLYVHSLPYKLR